MTFTASQIFAFVVAVIGLTLTILNIADRVSTMRKNANQPIKDLQEEVIALKVKVAEHEQKLRAGNDNFRSQKKINTLFERIQLAFVDFEVAYCQSTGYKDLDSLLKAKELLTQLLTNEEK